MGIYTKGAKQMLIDLINEANPDLPFSINTVDYDFTPPVAIDTLPNGHNTQLRVAARSSAPYIGNVLLTYRRISLNNLFRNVTPHIEQWVPSSGSPSSSTVIADLHSFLPIYSQKYGILLEPSQIQNVSLRNYNGLRGDSFTIAADPNSWAYVGSTQATWAIGQRTMADLIQVTELEGRRYPQSNEFDPEVITRKNYLTPLTYAVDYTVEVTNSGAFTGQRSVLMWRNAPDRIIDELIMNILRPVFQQEFSLVIPGWPGSSGDHYSTPVTGSGVIGMRDLRVTFFETMGNTDFPEVNSEFYNKAIVVEIPEDCPWGTGNIIIHYNQEGV